MKKIYKKSILFFAVLFLMTCIFTGLNMNEIIAETGTVLPSYVDTVSSEGLIAHYKFDENLKDASGKGNDGTAKGEITFVNSMIGKGARFDKNAYIEVNNSDSLLLNSSFTISMWLYKDDFSGKDNGILKMGEKFDLYHWGNGFNPALYVNDNNMTCEEYISNQYWHLLTIDYDSSNNQLKYYKDGKLIYNEYCDGMDSATDGSLIIGSCTAGGENLFFKGIIDDLRIYNRALESKEVNALYNDAMKTKDTKGRLVAHYMFDGDLKDSSGNNNDGKIGAGEITYIEGKIGKGAKFDGKSFIEVKDNDSLDLDKTFTISAWLYKEPTNGYLPVVAKGIRDTAPAVPYTLYYDYGGDQPTLMVSNSNSWNRIAVNNLYTKYNVWDMVSVAFDSIEKKVKFYVNGEFKGADDWDGGELHHTEESLLIGYGKILGDTAFYKGYMDDLRIYNYSLSDKEIKDLYVGAAPKLKEYKSITITPDKIATIKVKGTIDVKATGVMSDGKKEDITKIVTYKSSNEKVAAISKDGKITGMEKGTSTITVTYGKLTKQIKVTVK